NNSWILIFEDIQGDSLKNLIADRKINLATFLHIAIQLTNSLAELHTYHIIHKDIKPANIIVNLETEQVRIIDFSISARVPLDNQMIVQQNLLEGTLTYMSPEQTGRMNHPLDYRTDYYSLGIVFYEMLIGHPPFQSKDSMELVHCHLARPPVPPCQINPDVPKVLSDIVMKLLVKVPEGRYQSTYGLKTDLIHCLQQLQTTGNIEDFVCGQHDILNRFQIPQKLYGRETEIVSFLQTFERVNQGTTQLLLIIGPSGIGKTSLGQEMGKIVMPKQGNFIVGKFDQFRRDIPYAAIISAFSDLVHQLLMANESRLQRWREKLSAILGANGQIVVDFIPEVEIIVGSQPPVPKLGPVETQNRFNLMFQSFLRVLCTPTHPLVIFFDDLQWADSASLKLIKLMLTDEQTHSLLIIGTYRNNEVSASSPLMTMLASLRKEKAVINHIHLVPLQLAFITEMIVETLHCAPAMAEPLAELVLQKTNGNPFFAKEFLKTLYEENLLKFIPPTTVPYSHPEARSISKNVWQWDKTAIENLDITDNVVELLISRLKKLQKSTQQVLHLAACIGNRFDLEYLAFICQKTIIDTFQDLKPAIQENLINIVGEQLATNTSTSVVNQTVFIDEPTPITESCSPSVARYYKFSHDRVQQAAYTLMDENQKQIVHLQIGLLLLRKIPKNALADNIFDIVNQLNLSINLVTERQQQEEFAELNLLAGKKAKTAAAYESALNYLKMGIYLLDASGWQKCYALTLALYTEAVETAYLCTQFEEMERLAAVVLRETNKRLDKVKIYEIKIQACQAQNKLLEAIDTAREVLKLLRIQLPKKPSILHIIAGALQTKFILMGRSIENLANLPEMTDPYKLAAMRILVSVMPSAYFAVPELLPIIIFKEINLSIRYGNSPVSSFTYAGCGLLYCGILGEIDTGYRFGQLAVKLLTRFNTKRLEARTLMLANVILRHWKAHVRDSLKPIQDIYQIAIENGDFEYAAFIALNHSYHAFLIGRDLVTLEREIAARHEIISQFKQKTALHVNQIYWQAVQQLLGRPSRTESVQVIDNPCRLIGKTYDEKIMLSIHQHANDKTSLFSLYFIKLILCYLFRKFPQAVDNADKAETYLTSVIGLPVVPVFYFYDSLARLAVYNDYQDSQQRRFLKKVAANQKKMYRWAQHAPMNYLHRFYLVEAEWKRVLGQIDQAIEYYDQAIALAAQHEYIQEEALANELAGRFWLNKGKKDFAQLYLQKAFYNYSLWGAQRKVADLEKQFPQLLTASASVAPDALPTAANTTTSHPELLDLATVMKASQAISGEIVLDQLVKKLMRVVIENAGAEVGFLILEKQGQFWIEAEVRAGSQEVSIFHSLPLESESQQISAHLLVPITLINYVLRTQNELVLNDVTHIGMFAADPYIKQYQPKSVLCMPMIYQGHLIGALYLENNLVPQAFTADRLTILELLSTQIAISLQNALLYRQNEQARHEAETANRAKSTFLANMSHELRTPLNAIIGYSDLITEDATDMGCGEIVPDLNKIQNAAKQLLGIISGVLDISKIEADKMELNNSQFEVNDIIKDVVTLLQPMLTEEGNQLIVNCQPDVGKLYADVIKVQQILVNLLTNAIKFTRKGTITLEVNRSFEWLTIAVTDTGIGIAPNQIENIFKPFHQADNSTTRQYGGTGLGLTICERFCRLMDGHIDVISELGKGSTFTVQLPIHFPL
ncbi:MAG: hypothetical protein BWK79_11235, partial [Beggiatoa sp. IS2]